MSRQVGSLHRSNSHPANFQNPVPIIPLFALPPPDFAIINIPSSTSSDTNSDISVFQTFSQFNNSDLETPDGFANSETSPSTYSQTNPSHFSQPLFNPSMPVNHYHPFPLPLMHPKSLQHIPHPFQTNQPITPQILHKFSRIR